MDTKKRPLNWLFWLEATVLAFLAVYFSVVFFNKVSGGFYAVYPWMEFFQALFLLIATGFFVARKAAGWYLVAGYFCCLPVFALCYQTWAVVYYDIWDTLSLEKIYYLFNAFLIQLLAAGVAMVLLCLPGIRSGIFGIASKGLVLRIGVAAAIAATVMVLAPWLLGAF